jgi:hypothetical protein
MTDQINPKVLTQAASIDAYLSYRIETAKRLGKSEDEITREEIRRTRERLFYVHEQLIFMQVLSLMCERIEREGINTSKTTLGYTLFNEGITQKAESMPWMKLKTPEASAWVKLIKDVKSLNGLWQYFLRANGIDKRQVQSLAAYDHRFFQALLKTPVHRCKHFGLNAAECK